jgi:hypothetical protein
MTAWQKALCPYPSPLPSARKSGALASQSQHTQRENAYARQRRERRQQNKQPGIAPYADEYTYPGLRAHHERHGAHPRAFERERAEKARSGDDDA